MQFAFLSPYQALHPLKIVTVLEMVNTEKLCIGNPDKRLASLVEACNGSFKDPTGELHLVYYIDMKFLLQVRKLRHM